MTPTELNEFWNKKPIKIWVVNLHGTGRNRQTDRKIVRAKTIEGALLCAKKIALIFITKNALEMRATPTQ